MAAIPTSISDSFDSFDSSFSTAGSDSGHISDEATREEEGSGQPSHISAALCPITSQLFEDPVIVHASGHSYER